tara:strand:+ start:1364 stop:2842 length:1479 start_codon:yes stop_codon:yes gene_type:complete
MSLNDIRKRLIVSLKNRDPSIRKVAIREISNSVIPDRYRILENWLEHEKSLSIITQIEEILQNADWFDEDNSRLSKAKWNDEHQKIIAHLQSDDIETIKKVFTFLVKNRRRDFLSKMLTLEKRFDDSYLKICNIRLLSSCGEQSLGDLKNYLEFPDREVQRMALEAISNLKIPEAIRISLIQSYVLGPDLISIVEKFLAKWNSKMIFDVIQELKEDSDPKIRLSVAFWCGKIFHSVSFNCCEVLIGDDDRLVVQMAWKSIEALSQKLNDAKDLLTKVGSKNHDSKLIEKRKKIHDGGKSVKNFNTMLMEYKSGDQRQKASVLQKIGFLESYNEMAIRFLKNCITDEDARVRANAIEALVQLQSKTDIKILLDCLKDSHNRVIGNACLALYQKHREELFAEIYRALNDLGESNHEAPRLTLVFFVDQTRDERFLPLIRSQFKQQKFDLVRERSLKLLEDWSKNSPGVMYELEEWKRSFQIQLDEEEPLDEFLE